MGKTPAGPDKPGKRKSEIRRWARKSMSDRPSPKSVAKKMLASRVNGKIVFGARPADSNNEEGS